MTEVPSDFEWRRGPAGQVLVCRPLDACARHLFSSRDLRYRDDRLEADRRSVAAALDVNPPDVFSVSQVHGCQVMTVTMGVAPPRESAADGLITARAGTAVSVLVADCVPVLIADRHGRAVAAVHAGWRGTAAAIVMAAVQQLETMGIPAGDLVAAIGPSIGPCCYQVDAPVKAAFARLGDGAEAWFTADGDAHWRLDLWRANRDQLTRAGVRPSSVFVARLCTADHLDRCWSYRREGRRTGRMVAAIALSAAKP
ncbi:MAG: peptidoglycan editing factor PgeF [Acidobacteria bacterium]|nr:peptidoglycan editing factor PgeF [Acidobacteriota bacterium]